MTLEKSQFHINTLTLHSLHYIYMNLLHEEYALDDKSLHKISMNSIATDHNLPIQCRAVMTVSKIVRYYIKNCRNLAEYESDAGSTKDTPHLAYTERVCVTLCITLAVCLQVGTFLIIISRNVSSLYDLVFFTFHFRICLLNVAERLIKFKEIYQCENVLKICFVNRDLGPVLI